MPGAIEESGPDSSKPALRALFRERRRSFVAGLSADLSADTRTRLERDLARIVAPLARLPQAQAAAIASHASVGDEIDPQFAEQVFGPHGFPRIEGDQLRFHLAPWSALKPGRFGIPEPQPTAPEIVPQLLLVPLIAATPGGVRLGQGGGWYDRTLARLRAERTTIAVGLAWECQLADALPCAPHDQRLDWIATPSRLVECAAFR
jgi:5-formyltetrahydrofolate cyclo-ligase